MPKPSISGRPACFQASFSRTGPGSLLGNRMNPERPERSLEDGERFICFRVVGDLMAFAAFIAIGRASAVSNANLDVSAFGSSRSWHHRHRSSLHWTTRVSRNGKG